MHSLINVFAVWRLQADTVVGILRDKKYKCQSKQLVNAIKLIDKIWVEEHGEAYVSELVRLINLMHAQDDLPAFMDQKS